MSSPRIGKTKVLTYDNGPYYRAENRFAKFLFFGTCGARVFGAYLLQNFTIDRPRSWPEDRLNKRLLELADSKGREVELRADLFLTQRVLCHNGQWVSRGEVIKYVANVTSVLHSGTPDEPEEKILAQIRRAHAYRPSIDKDGKPGISIHLFEDGLDSTAIEFRYKPNSIDPVLVEVLAAARFLVDSPDIQRLEKIIMEEFSARL